MEPWQVATAMRALRRAKPAVDAGTLHRDEQSVVIVVSIALNLCRLVLPV